MDAWIGAVVQQLASGVASLAGFAERHGWIGAEREQLLFAGKAIGEAPELTAGRAYEKIKATVVAEFIIARAGLA
jgi:hypothetical protein